MSADQKTTDMLARLRAGEPCSDDPCRVKEARSGCICAAAADEIERLRAVVRVNALRWAPHLTHAEIDEVINGK